MKAQFDEELRESELEIINDYTLRQHRNEESHRETITELIKRHEMMEIKIQE